MHCAAKLCSSMRGRARAESDVAFANSDGFSLHPCAPRPMLYQAATFLPESCSKPSKPASKVLRAPLRGSEVASRGVFTRMADEEGAAEEVSAPKEVGALSAEEVAALKEASITTTDCCKPNEEGLVPKVFAGAFGRPLSFFSLLRNPNEDPPDEIWDVVREKWPVLAKRSNEELLVALKPIKAEYVDVRYL